jgi:hypothetical protein
MKTINNLSLTSVTGGAPMGVVNPCLALTNKKLREASTNDIARAVASCGLKLPTDKEIADATNLMY